MSLRQQAERDLETILENPNDFGWLVSVTDPDGNSGNVYGSSGDIGQVIDPDLGVAVSGRRAYIAIRIASLVGQGLGLPVGVHESNRKPWRVTFDDIGGASHNFKVIDSMPDRTLGVVTCELGIYK